MLEKKKLNVENTVIVGIINAQQDEEQSKEYLDELAFLALTAGGRSFNGSPKNQLAQPQDLHWERKTGRGTGLCRSQRCFDCSF